MVKKIRSRINYAVYQGMAIWILGMLFFPGTVAAGQEKTGSDAAAFSEAFLYFADVQGTNLTAVARQFPPGMDAHRMGRAVLDALMQGPTGERGMRIFPEHTRVTALFITEDNDAYVDLAVDLEKMAPTDTMTEYLGVYSLVNTLTVNIPQIKQVKILLNGEEDASLGGHISLAPFFKTNMLIVK